MMLFSTGFVFLNLFDVLPEVIGIEVGLLVLLGELTGFLLAEFLHLLEESHFVVGEVLVVVHSFLFLILLLFIEWIELLVW